jgi:selenocysteine lyase/cysteine desulfurase
MDWTQLSSAGGHFEVGTVANATAACLGYSLDYILRMGVEKIQAHRQPLLDRLQSELPRLGFQAMTPAGSTSPIVTFAKQDTAEVSARLRRAAIDIAVYPHRIRISPSVYNDQADIDRLLEALG